MNTKNFIGNYNSTCTDRGSLLTESNNSLSTDIDTLNTEEIVDILAPVGKSDMISYISTSFSPVAEELAGASMY